MATAVGGNRNCYCKCGKEKSTYKCAGCLRDYCKNHLREHETELELELDKIENKRNILRQTLPEQIEQPTGHRLVQQINQWEQKSINKIQQIAEENRQLILKYMSRHFETMEIHLTKLTNEIKETRRENDFNELNLTELRDKLGQLQEQLNNPANISIREDNSSSSFIDEIYVNIEPQLLNIPISTTWKQNAVTVSGGNGEGHELNQLSKPWGICIDEEKTIYVADQGNHRIVKWKKDAICGETVAGGNENHRLNFPTKAIIDEVNDCLIIADLGNKRVVRWPRRPDASREIMIENIICIDIILHQNQYLYILDIEKQEVRRWKLGENEKVIVAGGNGCGSNLNQLNNAYFICIDQEEALYVSDSSNHRVVKWIKDAKEGIVIVGGHGKGADLKQLSYPQGIFVDRLGTLYIVDQGNYRIVRWIKGAKEGSIIVDGNSNENQLDGPIGLSFDNENNLYIVDCNNHRIQKFDANN